MSEHGHDGTGAGDAAERRRRRHRRRWFVGITILVILVVGGGVIAYLWSRTGARPVSVEEAERRFREKRTTGPRPGSVLRPAEGVYRYRGSGTEHISTPPKSEEQGPEIPGTVVHGADGCWRFRVDYSTNHWQDWSYCSVEGRLEEQGGRSFQRWDLVFTTIESSSEFTCDPPAVTIRPEMRPGEHWRQSCEGTTSSVDGVGVSSGPYRFVGLDRVEVGDRRVDAYHFVQRRTLTGAQTGTQRAEVWFGLDGLPLRNVRSVEVDTDTIIGSVTYTEEGEFRLASLRPRT